MNGFLFFMNLVFALHFLTNFVLALHMMLKVVLCLCERYDQYLKRNKIASRMLNLTYKRCMDRLKAQS